MVVCCIGDGVVSAATLKGNGVTAGNRWQVDAGDVLREFCAKIWWRSQARIAGVGLNVLLGATWHLQIADECSGDGVENAN